MMSDRHIDNLLATEDEYELTRATRRVQKVKQRPKRDTPPEKRRRFYPALKPGELIPAECQVPGLFYLMRDRDVTVSELAKHLGRDLSSIHYWKRGDSSPTLIGLKRLAEYFECSLDLLVYWRGDAE